MSLTSIIILTFNNLEKTKQCLESIRKFTKQPYELIFIDNGSTDGTIQYLKQFSDIKLICNRENRGFAGGCNQGMKLAKGDQLLLLNNDTIVSHNWLDNLLKALYISPKVGMVSPLTNFANPPGVMRRVGSRFLDEAKYHRFARGFNRHDPSKWKVVQVLYGFCILLKRNVLNDIGWLDEQFGIGTVEDVDYSYRAIRAGYTLLIAGDTFVHHYGHATFNENQIISRPIARENWRKFEQKWGVKQESFSRLNQYSELIPDGSWVKGNEPTIYYIDEQSRYPIQDIETLHTLKASPSDAIQIPQSELVKYTIGETINQQTLSKKIPNHLLIKPSNRDEYYLTQNGQKRRIENQKVWDLFGFRKDRVISLPPDYVDSMEGGPNLSAEIRGGALWPNRAVIRSSNQHYLSVNHILYPITQEYLNLLHLSIFNAVVIPPKLLYQFPIGKEIVYNWHDA